VRPLGLVAAALVVLAGCGGADDPAPPPGPTAGAETTEPATTSPTTTAAPTGTATAGGPDTGWDCAAVEQARQDLAAATNEALERVGIDRSDPRAFSVQVLVTAKRGDEYWTTVRDAIPPEETGLLADAATVVSYWSSVNEELDAVDVPSGDPAALQQATDRYLEVMAEHPEVEVLPVQERLTAGVDAACADTASS
jgi:hypothetical protein